jgi:hypothetical protein
VRSSLGRLALAVTLASLLGATTAQAADFTVTSTDDAGPGTLRQAIDDANGAAGPDTITISATGTITLMGALPAIADSVEINGPGQALLTIDAGGASQVFIANGGVSATIRDLVATNGLGLMNGGAIFDGGTLTLTRVTVSNSTASSYGGGIEVAGGAKLDASEITVSGNSGNISINGTGGGINVESGGTLHLDDSTVSGNSSTDNAGGVRVQGAATIRRSTINGNMALGGFAGGIGVTSATEEGGAGSLKLENSTVTDNSATTTGGGMWAGGNVDVVSSTFSSNSAPMGANVAAEGGGTATLLNSIVAAPLNGPNCVVSGGTLTSLGHNIDDGSAPGSCGFAASGDQVGVDPKLGALVDNGGPTLTRAPADDSPAVNHGTAEGLVASANGRVTDQRGVLRPVGSDADIGAVELAPPTAITGAASGLSSSSATVSGSATNPHVEPGQAFFQYGPASNPTQSQTSPVVVAAGANSAAESVDLGSLEPSTTYHYRLVVNNAEGSSVGEDRTFTTAAAPVAPQPNPNPNPNPEPNPNPNPEPGTPTPPDNPASVLISHRRLPLVKSKVKVVLVCLGAKGKRCTGKFALTATDKTTRFRSARRSASPGTSFDLEAGAKLTLLMKLPGKTSAQLKQRHHAVVRGTATLTSGGPTTTRLLTVNRH